MSVASGSGGSPAVGRSGSSASARRSIVGSARSGSPAVGSSGSANVMPPTRRLSTRTPGIAAAAANSDGARPSTPGTGSKTDSVTATDSAAGARAGTPTRAQTQSSTGGGGVLSAAEQLGEITSPHELTEWVDIVLNQLEDKFDLFNGQVQDRMKEMSARIEALESSIQELVTGTAGGTAPPAT
ncbi:hypothetical protein CF326_g1820 [Tilletia indica]|nr:hypothetical protein CF326_g1820 [Tilletia indica]